MNEIQDGGINQFLRRRFTVVDTAAPAGSLAPEVFPVVLAPPPSSEDQLLLGVYPCGGGTIQNGVAGQYAHFRLANLSAARMLVMVDRIIVSADPGASISAGLSTVTTLYANQRSTGVRDTRILPTTTTRQTHAVLSSETNITPPLTLLSKSIFFWRAPASERPVVLDVGCVLAPGTSFEVGHNSVNAFLCVCILWRERLAQPSELG